MSDLISRSALLKSFKQRCQGNCKKCDHSTFLASDEHCGLIDEAPTVEARPVVRGEWKKESMPYGDRWYCSECKNDALFDVFNYQEKSDFCPHCGADMRGEKNG